MRRESWMRSKVNRPEFISSSGRVLSVAVRRRKGTRHMRLSIDLHNQIVASLPWHCSDRACQKFIDQNRNWLEKQINAAPEVSGLREWLKQSPRLSAGGRSLAVSMHLSSTARAHYRINVQGSCIEFYLPDGSGEVTRYNLVLQFAKAALSDRAAELASRIGVTYRRLSVRNQSSRWGSCSSRGTISLNWRLVLIEPRLQDYVIYHEFAHLTEMNHSRRFWTLLDRYDPQREEHEKELDALTPKIMRVRW
ncbi:hypothetical protein DDZ13_06210 [Coraliomargarita sinensis]|uniref:YgjP-like metallopeptidase domain-containing protein n=1 Tax=Coraliomargarita sinensis TaxID=2174842 RepID=A0A317ZH36_9BACT|nr:SprT family zinc-dependent metalloprotease [Coraliomargarita sinensis]PXA04760.1 hypothetical protein DDZ13_06210 [Coraliomargarita sinensis]